MKNELSAASVYHGTSRFGKEILDRDKSKSTGDIVDILHNILDQGLLPTKDHLARLFLETEKTISLTHEFNYACCYAQRFSNTMTNESREVYNFYTNKTKELSSAKDNIKYIPLLFKNLYHRFTPIEIYKMMNIEYHKNTRLGTIDNNMTNNYPIVLEYSLKDIEQIKIPKGLDKFELRTDQLISPTKIQAIFTPDKNIEDIVRLLDREELNIPVKTLQTL